MPAFMVNVDNGTAKDCEDLVAHVIEAVGHLYVRLETVVRIGWSPRTFNVKNN